MSFTGHETFKCRTLWLKKGYDFVVAEKSFSKADAVVDLGVGKNMVNAIRYWCHAFGILENDKPTPIAHYLLGPSGKDIYLENAGTIWLLHHHLVKTRRASIYNLFFNHFRRERIEFTRKHLLDYIKSWAQISRLESFSKELSENTLKEDIEVLVKNYLEPSHEEGSVEDEFSGLLQDLKIMTSWKDTSKNVEAWLKVENSQRPELPKEIFLFCVLDNPRYSNSISFDRLLNEEFSPGRIFALSGDGVFNKMIALRNEYDFLTYQEDGGVREFQFRPKPSPFDILDLYYGN